MKKFIIILIILFSLNSVNALEIQHHLEANTYGCFDKCSLKFCFNLSQDYYIDDLSKFKIKFENEFGIEKSNAFTEKGINLKQSKIVEKEVWISNIVCENTLNYLPNGSLINLNTCNDNGYFTTEEIIEIEYLPFNPLYKTIKANKNYCVEIWANKKPVLGDNNIDAIPIIGNLILKEYDWWNSSLNRKQEIILDTSLLNNDIDRDMPILINFTNDSNPLFWDYVNIDGSDVRFVNENETETLDFHFEKFNYSARELIAWVEVRDIFDSDTNTSIFIYFENNTFISSGENSNNTYTDDIVGVWHFNENILPVRDSTKNNNDFNSQDGSPLYKSSGIVGNGYAIGSNGDDAVKNLAYNNWFDNVNSTFSHWVKSNDINTEKYMNGHHGSENGYFSYTEANTYRCWAYGGGALIVISTSAVSGNWDLITCKVNSTSLSIFVNGIEQDSEPLLAPINSEDSAWYWLSRWTYGQYWNGYLDEHKIWQDDLNNDEIYLIWLSESGKLLANIGEIIEYEEIDITPPNMTQIYFPNLLYNSSGTVNYTYLICDDFGIANLSFGELYQPYFFTANLHNSENYNTSHRCPPNNLTFGNNCLRHNVRNTGLELEYFIKREYGDSDIWSWGNYENLEIYYENDTCIKVNISYPDVHLLFPNYFILHRREALKENTTNQYINLNKNNIVMIVYNLTQHNFTQENFSTYKHYNIDFSNTIFPTLGYKCNESYILNGFGDYINSPNCQLSNSFINTDLRTVTIYNNSFVDRTYNYENGYFGDVKLTKKMVMIFDNKIVSPTANMPKFYYNNNSIPSVNIGFKDTNTLYTSTDGGNSWNVFNGSPNFFYTYASLNNVDILKYYMRDCDKNLNCINHTIYNDTLEEAFNPPPKHFIINPSENEVFYNDTNYSIEWIKGSYFYDYNTTVYLVNQSNTSNITTLCENLNKSIYLCNYNFSLIPIGNYYINLTSINEYGVTYAFQNFSIGVRPVPVIRPLYINIINKDFNTIIKVFASNGTFHKTILNEENIVLNSALNYTFMIYPSSNLVLNNPNKNISYLSNFVGLIFGIIIICGIAFVIIIGLINIFRR